MPNLMVFKDKKFNIGDTISITYKIKEGDKERQQIFKGILLKLKGQKSETKMFTTRKVTRSGIGVERIIPLSSPYIADIKLIKKGNYRKSRLNFLRGLPEHKIKQKLYRPK